MERIRKQLTPFVLRCASSFLLRNAKALPACCSWSDAPQLCAQTAHSEHWAPRNSKLPKTESYWELGSRTGVRRWTSLTRSRAFFRGQNPSQGKEFFPPHWGDPLRKLWLEASLDAKCKATQCTWGNQGNAWCENNHSCGMCERNSLARTTSLLYTSTGPFQRLFLNNFPRIQRTKAVNGITKPHLTH